MTRYTEKQYERWGEYPLESHEGHDRVKTGAPNVWFCYDCSQHYRQERDKA